MGGIVAALGITACMLTSGLFVASAPTRARALRATAGGVIGSLALWMLIATQFGPDGLIPTVLLGLLLAGLTALELNSGLRRATRPA